jgi:integrase
MLRVPEAVGTTWEAVDKPTLWVHGTDEKYRAVPIADPSTWTYLHAYTNALRTPLEQRFQGAFFRQLDHEERPITKHTIEHLLLSLRTHFQGIATVAIQKGDSLAAQALKNLIDKLHSHIFRATGATFMAAAGMNLATLSMLLGHADPSTTQRYYLAADQVVLPDSVRQICSKISVTLQTSSGIEPAPRLAVDPLQRSGRRGLLPPGKR